MSHNTTKEIYPVLTYYTTCGKYTTKKWQQLILTALAQWLRCCATNWKVDGSIPDGVAGIFHLRNPSNRIMALGWTQPLTEYEYQEYSLWVKAAGA